MPSRLSSLTSASSSPPPPRPLLLVTSNSPLPRRLRLQQHPSTLTHLASACLLPQPVSRPPPASCLKPSTRLRLLPQPAPQPATATASLLPQPAPQPTSASYLSPPPPASCLSPPASSIPSPQSLRFPALSPRAFTSTLLPSSDSYPSDVFTKLCIVDSLEKLGINHHFEDLMKEILDETYRRWVQNDEEIHSEIFTCAMAFRLLRMHGYDICSDVFAQLDGDTFYWSSTDGNSHNMKMVLELHRASQIKVSQTEKVLENLNSWSTNFLRQKISHGPNNELEKFVVQEVDHALRFPYHANLERTEHKINIENFNYCDVFTLKTSFMLQNIDTQDIVRLAVEEFNACQATYQSELHFIERWVKESRLDQLKFARQKVEYCYFSAAATLFSPEMSNVRLSWAKNSILTTVIDDFFDIGGSREELLNFIELVGRWDENYKNNCCSKQVNIIFSALYSTVNEFGEKASAIQGRNVTSHLIEIWLDLINSMMREADWLRDMIIPTLDQYLTNGYTSFASGPIILPALYLVGPKLSLDTVRNPEYHNLYKLVSTCGRLLNDIQGFEREGNEGKLNSVSLCVLHGHGAITEEDAKRNLRSIIDTNRTELLRLVLLNKGSVIPRACKDLFWKMSRILHVFYAKNDGFTSPTEMMGAVSAVIYEPLKVPQLFSADFSK